MTELPVWLTVETVNGRYSVKLDQPDEHDTGWILKIQPWDLNRVEIIGTHNGHDDRTIITARQDNKTIATGVLTDAHLFTCAPDLPDGTTIGCKVRIATTGNLTRALMLAAAEAVTRVLAALKLLEA